MTTITSCPSTQFYHSGTYVAEIWTWFGIGTLVVFLRLAVRICQVGLLRLHGDDYLAFAVWICFVGKSIALTLVYLYGSNIDYGTLEAVAELSDCQVERLVLGSRMEMLAWYTYCAIIWGLKGIVLFMFHRLTFSLDRPRLFRAIAIVTGLTFVAMYLSLTVGCLPFHLNWQVRPPPPAKCSMRMPDVYVSTWMNVGTDIMILAIPLPALWKMKVSPWRKVGLVLLMCSGFFVISAALVRFGFTIVGSTSMNLNRWCQRESTVGIVAVNAAVLRSAFKRKEKQMPLRVAPPSMETKTFWTASSSPVLTFASPPMPACAKLSPVVTGSEASTSISEKWSYKA